MADTDLQQLVINVGTKAQIEAGISGGTITQDMLSVATDSTDYVTDVQVNSTSVTTNGVANIDLTGKLDKVTAVSKVYGTDASGNQTTYDKDSFGQVDDVQVNGTSVVTNKVASVTVPTQPSDIGAATSAQGTKADSAIQSISLGGAGQTPDANKNVNIPLATNSYVGVCRGSTPNGVIASSGVLSIVAASDAELQAKTQAYHPVVPAHLDVAIREGLGNNSLTWTDAYKESARNTIGSGAKTIIREWIG